MELNDFKPLITEIILCISEGKYDEVQGFLIKNGRLTLDTLRTVSYTHLRAHETDQ